jgi:hypothetical protein
MHEARLRLPEEFLEIVASREFEELFYPEIAEVLRCSTHLIMTSGRSAGSPANPTGRSAIVVGLKYLSQGLNNSPARVLSR